MTSNSRWERGSNQYKKRPGNAASQEKKPRTPATAFEPTTKTEQRLTECGILWNPALVDVSRIPRSATARVLARFRAALPDLIWNTASLEGNNFTFPEVVTLLEGVSVGGKRNEDVQQILNLQAGYSYLYDLVRDGAFKLTKEISDEIHKFVVVDEANEAGHFRGEGQATNGGTVRLANGGTVPGREHGDNGKLLIQAHSNLLTYLDNEVKDPREQALAYFSSATRHQFYCDGNKRTARLMMTGHLLSHGYESVNVEFARKLEFNTHLDTLFSTDDATQLMNFLADSALW